MRSLLKERLEMATECVLSLAGSQTHPEGARRGASGCGRLLTAVPPSVRPHSAAFVPTSGVSGGPLRATACHLTGPRSLPAWPRPRRTKPALITGVHGAGILTSVPLEAARPYADSALRRLQGASWPRVDSEGGCFFSLCYVVVVFNSGDA